MSRSQEHSKDDASQAYAEYLLLLQERNRLLKKLRAKDSKQQEIEKREQGFSLYLNGANVDLRLAGVSSKKSARRSKTAGESTLRHHEGNLGNDDSSSLRETLTAPSKTTRKNWGATGGLRIKTDTGTKIEVNVPDKITGQYSEDFELYESYLEAKLEEEEAQYSIAAEEDPQANSAPAINVTGDTHGVSDEQESDNEESSNHLTFTLQDVKLLRESLEKDEEIARSIKEATSYIGMEDDHFGEGNKAEGKDYNKVLTSKEQKMIVETEKLDDSKHDSGEEIDEEIDFGTDTLGTGGGSLLVLGQPKLKGEDVVYQDDSSRADIKGRKEYLAQSVDQSDSFNKLDAKGVGAKHANQTEMTDSNYFADPVITFQSCSARPRPLSATRKVKEDLPSPISTFNTREIVKAMAQENESVFTSQQGQRSKNTIGNPRYSDVTSLLQGQDKGLTQGISNETICHITDRVKKLSSAQQVKLLNMLSEIENLETGEWQFMDRDKVKCNQELNENTEGFEMVKSNNSSNKDSYLSQKNEKGKQHVTTFGRSIEETKEKETKPSFDLSFEDVGNRIEMEYTEVVIEVFSNWGHPEFSGCTEIDFYGRDGNMISLSSESVKVTSDHISLTSPSLLVNGKTRTTREKSMWKCKNRDGQNIELLFLLPIPPTEYKRDINKIIIWNYNRSLKELAIGLKDIRIFVGGEIVWTGIIDKGCGNKMFDYSKIIYLYPFSKTSSIQSDEQAFEQVPRCETRTLLRSPYDIESLPVVDMESPQLKTLSPDKHEIPSAYSDEHIILSHRATEICDSSSKVDLDEKYICSEGADSTDCASRNLLRSHFKGPIEFGIYNMEKDFSNDMDGERSTSPMPKSGGSDTSVPIWLLNKNCSGLKTSPTMLDRVSSDPFNIMHDRATPSSGRRSAQGSQDSSQIPQSANSCVVSAGRRAGSARSLGRSETLDNLGLEERGHEDILPTLLDSAYEPEVLEGSPHWSKSKRTFKLQAFENDENLNLEESLKCINKFDKEHRGRITKDVDFSHEGDVMDDLIRLTKTEPVVISKEDVISEGAMQNVEDNVLFEIPVLPSGKHMKINIKSTWGDRHYVGLNGIEIFEDNGNIVKNMRITADPPDINVLPEYDNDPRIISNVLDGVYMTRDDMHLWLTPFTPGQNHHILMTFESIVTIAMIRVWNYNKSRIHSYRGVKEVEIMLDDKLIFQGEIARASGVLSKSSEPYGDLILFTMDEDILEAIAQNDFLFKYSSDDEDQLMESINFYRPTTADIGDSNVARPFTSAKTKMKNLVSESFCLKMPAVTEDTSGADYDGHCLELNFTETWGDPYYLGLTGLEVLDQEFNSINISVDMVSAVPQDLNDLPEFDDDDRTLDKLFDGINVTMSDEHMWMIPFNAGSDHFIIIRFPETRSLSGIRIWNYNKSAEDTYRGAKIVHVAIDGKVISPDGGYLLRKGPGQCHFDFAQDILFSADDQTGVTSIPSSVPLRQARSEVDTMSMPTGFVFQLRLYGSWGDHYYVGLNGLEFYDSKLCRIDLTPNNITAYPHSVNVLDETINDVRTPDKLIDGINDTYDGRHTWLAPIFPEEMNVVYIVFDQPVTVSMIKLWNYSKTPDRGVQQFGLFVDDLLVYNGVLPRVSSHSRGVLPTIDMPVPHYTVLFTDDENVVAIERSHILRNASDVIEQEIQLTNDRSVLNPRLNKASTKAVDPARRPMTSITAGKR